MGGLSASNAAGGAFCFDCIHARNFLDRVKSRVVILGLTLAYNSMFCWHVHTQSVNCNAANLAEKFQHCRIYADGVRSLDCFGRHNQRRYNCTWEPGQLERTYTLVVHDKRGCQVHHNIMGSSRSDLRFYTSSNVTVEVYQDVKSANCTKAIFRGSPMNMKRCDPPAKATFRRQFGRLKVKVEWKQADRAVIKHFHVKHGVLGSQRWSKSPARSDNAETCVLEDLNATLAYSVQIQCVTSSHCSQCDWSRVYDVPPELTVKPVVVDVKETDIGGQRLLTLTWEFSSNQQHDGYRVTVGKASGEEPKEHIRTAEPRVTLILSNSAYRLQVSAVNNVGYSPALNHFVQDESECLSVGKLNVTIHSNTSFTIYWGDNLIEKYVCYSAEWRTNGGKTVHMSFFQDRVNYRTLSPLPEALEPLKRYSLTLHTRPDKDTCNMKSVNHSESTYGNTQFYLSEGSPVSGPENITYTNVTQDSAVLHWLAIPEEDLRGFLLGYIIRYAEYNHNGWMTTERNITVGPEVRAYTLVGLKGSTEYEVQISGFTRAGEGAQSRASLFTITEPGPPSTPRSVLLGITVVTAVVIFWTLVIERAKAFLWPSIPNPKHSNALQKLGRSCEMDPLESFNTLKVQEGDTDSLQIVEKDRKPEDAPAASAAEALLPQLTQDKKDEEKRKDEDENDAEDENHLTKTSTALSRGPAAGKAADVLPYIAADAFTGRTQAGLHAGPPAFVSGYTSLEMFQQAIPQGAPVSARIVSGERQPEEYEEEEEEGNGEEMRPSSSNISKFSINSEELSTFL